MTTLIENKLETKINHNGYDLNINIHFYQSNNMPALLLTTDEYEPYDDITTNHSEEHHFDKFITLRSDEPDKHKLLKEYGWIHPTSVFSIPQGFIDIVFYELTDEAYAKVIEAAEDQGENYTEVS